MARIAYVNGRYGSIQEPAVAIEDRGYQFADGVYEVIKAVGGQPLDLDRHMARLKRSLGELDIDMPMSEAALLLVIQETVRRNRLKHAIIYVQVSRGVAPRNHLYPKSARPVLVVTVRRAPFPSDVELANGCKVVSLPDNRWARCDIKSISLLPNTMAKQSAKLQGAREAMFVDSDGMVTECSSSNAYIVDRDGRLITRPLGEEILGGVTRSVLLEMARDHGIELIERAFSLAEAKAAREAFLTSTSSLVMPITQIDDQVIGNGMPGSVTQSLLESYQTKIGLKQLA